MDNGQFYFFDPQIARITQIYAVKYSHWLCREAAFNWVNTDYDQRSRRKLDFGLTAHELISLTADGACAIRTLKTLVRLAVLREKRMTHSELCKSLLILEEGRGPLK